MVTSEWHAMSLCSSKYSHHEKPQGHVNCHVSQKCIKNNDNLWENIYTVLQEQSTLYRCNTN
jgi:hypothetical protein